MKIIISGLVITLFVGICCYCISQNISKDLLKELNMQRQLNKEILGLVKTERDKTDTLWKIILHIRQELSLLKLKECPKEEFKNIPFEIINWIDTLERISNGDDGVIHK